MWCEHDMGSCTHVAEQGKGTQGVGSDCMWCELHEWREVRAGCLECEGLCKVRARRNGVCAISLHQWLRSLYARAVREPSGFERVVCHTEKLFVARLLHQWLRA